MARILSTLMLLIAVPSLAFAQQPGQMDPNEMMRMMQQDPEAMQRMMREAEAAAKCMEDIDEKKLKALERRGKKVTKEIEQLCEAGKKDEALAKALTFAGEMRDDPTIKQLRKCSEGMTEMMQGMSWAQMPGVSDEPDPTDDDICS